MKIKLFLLTLFLPAGLLLAQGPSFVSDSLDSYVSRGMKDWQIPGMAIVIVKDGKVVVMKGYGVKTAGSSTPVDANTLFMIASNTKLFTATALAQLEYDHKLSLDDKVTRYLPDFRLYDTLSTQLVSIRDILCHRIGTKTFQGDFTYWNSNLSREEIMHKMRLMKPGAPFRQTWGYCNSCFLTAGQVIPAVTGQQWESYVSDSLLKPLQMQHTYTSLTLVPSGVTLATPYTTSFSGSLHPVPYDHWDNLGPAADLISSVSDLSHWLLFQLDSGRYDGRRVLPFAVLQTTRTINSIISSQRSSVLPTHITGYGLGLEVGDYNGRQVYWHTGGAGGMVSILTFVPEEKLGIAILTNQDNQNFYVALRHQLLDAYLDVPYTDRSKFYLTRFEKTMQDTLKTIHAWQARVKGAAPSLPLSAYCGHYTHPLYGSLDIVQSGKGLAVKFNSHDHLTARLDYMDNGEWLLAYDNIEYGIFSTKFAVNGGRVVSLETKQSDFVEEDGYTFVKE